MAKELADPETECLKLKKSINDNHRLAQTAAGEAVERGVLTGELLGQWKLLLPHGRFEGFVETHFDGSLRTAQVYMQAAKRVNALPKAQRSALLKSERSIAGLIQAPKSDDQEPSWDTSGEDDSTSTEPKDSASRPPRKGKDKPGDAFKDQRSKTVKTVESLLRAFDDLQALAPQPAVHKDTIQTCKHLLKIARAWS